MMRQGIGLSKSKGCAHKNEKRVEGMRCWYCAKYVPKAEWSACHNNMAQKPPDGRGRVSTTAYCPLYAESQEKKAELERKQKAVPFFVVPHEHGVTIQVCRSTWLHLYGFGAHGEAVDHMLFKESHLLVPSTQSTIGQGGSKPNSQHIKLVADELEGLHRTAGHHTPFKGNSNARYITDKDASSHFKIWLRILKRNQLECYNQMVRLNYFTSYDENNRRAPSYDMCFLRLVLVWLGVLP
jgi:hypothetical protein